MISERTLRHSEVDVYRKNNKKLKEMCQGDICFKEDTTRILNFSNHWLTDAEIKLLNRGLNFALKKKSNNLECENETEKLYMDILENDKVKILEKENLKT